MENAIHALELRLEQVEAQNRKLARRLRITSAAGLVAVAGALIFANRTATAQGDDVQNIVKAHCFAAVDEEGNVRGVFSGEKGKVGFVLIDKHQNTRIGLVEKKDFCSLVCNDNEGKTKVVLGVNEGSGVIEIEDKDGKTIFKKPD